MGETSQRERITELIKSLYSAAPEYLWIKHPTYSVFRRKTSGKWFAVIMTVPASKLGLEGDREVNIINVKCGSAMTGSLLLEKGFFPAYHMNKNTWLSVILDDTVSDSTITGLLDFSFAFADPKMPKTENVEEADY